jgi:catechol 2,3-dioxygenase-like lactoylglutathione lyase family enzyme
MAVLRMTHVGICVSDLERSLRFYRDLLGFRYRSELQVQGAPTTTLLRLADVDLRAVYLERDGTRIELLHYVVPGAVGTAEPRPLNARGLTHLSLRVDSVAETLQTLRAAAVAVLDETLIDFPDFGSAAVFICDPDGTLIELVQSPGDLEAPPMSS